MGLRVSVSSSRWVLGLLCATLSCPQWHSEAKVCQDTSTEIVTEASVNGKEAPTDGWTQSEMVPVRRLVMYNIGVSEVLHFGAIEGNNRLSFPVPNEKVDDLLKSFVFRDEAGGALKSIQYRSAPSLAELAAREFQSPVTLAQLLQTHRGQEVVMEQGGGEIRGTIWGVENRVTDGAPIETLVVWVDDRLKSYNLAKLDGIRFSSPTVQQKMKLCLQGLSESGTDVEMQELQLFVAGQGRRNIGFGYLVDSTLWRMTYRLNVADDTGTLQGWAHIDNSTGQDWKDVDLELRTGRPQVFSVELFAPLLATRSSLGLEVFDLPSGLSLTSPWLAATLQRHLTGVSDFMDRGTSGFGFPGGMGGGGMGGGMGGGGMGGAGMGGHMGGHTGGGMLRGNEGENLNDSDRLQEFMRRIKTDPEAVAERWTTEVRYRVQTLVNLKSGESAAIPIMTSDLPCRFFSEIDLTDAYESSNSQQCIEITNKGLLPLLGGPVTLQKDGDFLGDIVLGRLDVGASQAVPYADERSLSAILRQPTKPHRLKSLRMAGQSLVTEWHSETNGKLTVTNKDSLPKTAQVNVRLGEWMELVGPTIEPAPKSLDRDNGTAVFELQVPGGQSETANFTIIGTKVVPKNLEVLATSQVEGYLSNAEIQVEAKARETLSRWLELKLQIRQAQLSETKATAEKHKVDNRLREIRRDIELLQFDPVLAAPLIEQLKQAQVEKQAISDRQLEISDQISELQGQLKTFYDTLDVGS
ncbi:MAG: DUF4139 domain-containing protein [Planctomycetaceae bacterium]|nr:DUF4139 domain-containing protein [Planctomycetaceae bacterium]